MSSNLQRLVRYLPDPFEFARQGGQLDGEVDAGKLERLADVLRPAEAPQSVRYQFAGEHVGDKLFLHIALSGQLNLACQRCLEDLSCPIEAEGRLLLVPLGTAMPDDALEDDSYDPVHAGRDFDVIAAVEEELLLALPIAPVHGICRAPGADGLSEKVSPFAMLERLKRSID